MGLKPPHTSLPRRVRSAGAARQLRVRGSRVELRRLRRLRSACRAEPGTGGCRRRARQIPASRLLQRRLHVLADLSIWHILILVAVVTLMFGTKRIPEIGASPGKGIQAFKCGLQDAGNAIEEPPPP